MAGAMAKVSGIIALSVGPEVSDRCWCMPKTNAGCKKSVAIDST